MNIDKYVELLGQLFEPAYIVDAQRTIIFWNEAAEKMTGYNASMMVGRKCTNSMMMHINEQGEKLCTAQCPLIKIMSDGKKINTSFYFQHKAGQRIPVEARFMPIIDNTGIVTGAIEVFVKKGYSDQSSKSSVIKELVAVAYLDSVTNLPNKEYMENKIRKLLVLSADKPSEVALGLLVIEIQNLREFNNSGGIVAGNSLLTVIAKTLSKKEDTEEGSIVCKWYGGSFVILMNTNKINTLLNWANKLKVLLERLNVNGYEEENIKVAIGGIATQPGENVATVLKRLEEQLQLSKLQSDNISIM